MSVYKKSSHSSFPAAAICLALAWSIPLRAEDCEAPLYKNLGDHHHAITTNSQLAQTYFNQGLTLAYGFNHGAAKRSFQNAIELDPQCAMCYWGIGLVLGPNINAPMPKAAVPEAFEAAQKALELAEGKVSERERDYIEALAARYSLTVAENRSDLDRAYADAMALVAAKYPTDVDAQALYAEALLDTMPWNYWTETKEPRKGTKELVTALDQALALDSDHAGANHFYIHLYESVKPEQAIGAADRLRNLVPGSGHLTHMPSHIYLRVGRYHDATAVNLAGIAADKEYLANCPVPGDTYQHTYVPHNYGFLLAAASFEGRKDLSLAAARELVALSGHHVHAGALAFDTQDHLGALMTTMVRFGEWDDILATPEPSAALPYTRGVWHYARAIAHARLQKFAAAQADVDALALILESSELENGMLMGLNRVTDVLGIALAEAKGELAAERKDWAAAIKHFREGVALQDKLAYIEPPAWFHPVRLPLAAVLLESGDFASAEAVLKEDLERFPENGWALFGLVQSLEGQGRHKEAEGFRARFAAAWQYSDITLTSPRL